MCALITQPSNHSSRLLFVPAASLVGLRASKASPWVPQRRQLVGAPEGPGQGWRPVQNDYDDVWNVVCIDREQELVWKP